MNHTLQQRIIKSKATFPVTVVLALLLWLTGVQWPLDSSIPISGWWGNVSCPAWAIESVNLVCYGYTVYLLADLNAVYSLLGRRSTLHCSIFLLLWAAFSSFGHTLEEHLTLSFLLSGISCLLRCYQDSMPVRQTFALFLLTGLNSLFCPAVLWYVPFLYIVLSLFKGMNSRTFFAGLSGLLLPYWFLFVYLFYTDMTGVFRSFWNSFPEIGHIHFSGFSVKEWAVSGLALLLLVSGSVYMELNSYRDKIRTRLFLHTFLWLSLYSIALSLFHTEGCRTWMIPVLLGASLLGGHMYSLSSTRFSNYSFIIVSLLLLLTSVYSSWRL